MALCLVYCLLTALVMLWSPVFSDRVNHSNDGQNGTVFTFYREPWQKEQRVQNALLEAAVFGVGCLQETCVNGGVCRLVKKKPVCQCRPGFTGRYCEDVQLDLSCDDDSMKLKVLRTVLDELGVNTSFLHMSNPKCRVQDTSEYQLSAVLTRDNHTFCGTEVEVNGTHLIYSNELTAGNTSDEHLLAEGHLISRTSEVRIKFSCVYHYDRVMSLPYPLLASASLVTFMVEEGLFNVSMTLHPTSAFLETYDWRPIIPPSYRIYIQLKIHGPSPQNYFKLKLEECWATPSDNHSGNIQHQIITNGNANDSTVAMMSSINNSLTRFSMQMFHFISYPEVYLHCRIWLCQPNATYYCDKNKQNSGRHARDLNDPYRKVVSCGPIKLATTKEAGIRNPDAGISRLIIPGSVVAATMLVLLCTVAIAKALKKREQLSKKSGPDPEPNTS